MTEAVFQFTESISVAASPQDIWDNLADIEEWWPPSNPEHIDIEVRPRGPAVGVGTEVVFEERIAGIKGQAAGAITTWVPGREATWEGEAVYYYFGLPFRIGEGVCWSVEEDGPASRLSARVWAVFPKTLYGRFMEWYAIRLLNVVEHDREHARRELEYLKRLVEGNA